MGERRVKGTAPQGIPSRGKIREGGTKDFSLSAQRYNCSVDYADADGKETVREYECVAGCAVAELDRQSGVLGNAWRPNRDRETPVTPGIFGGDKLGVTYPDTGTASRFFAQPEWGPADFDVCPIIYQAKASSAERNAGCEGLEKGPPPASARSKAAEGRQNPLGEPRQNFHPTVKPVELACYLIKLYRGNNPNPVILDPFAGSGWVEIAGILEDVKTISIEAEWEYCVIGEARSKYWIKNKRNYLTEGTLPKYQPELPLFEEEK